LTHRYAFICSGVGAAAGRLAACEAGCEAGREAMGREAGCELGCGAAGRVEADRAAAGFAGWVVGAVPVSAMAVAATTAIVNTPTHNIVVYRAIGSSSKGVV